MPNARRTICYRALPWLLGLLLLLGGLPGWSVGSAATAHAARPPAATASLAAQSAAPSADVQPLAEAYLLLLEHYAVPLDAANLVRAGVSGMDAALQTAGATGLPPLDALPGNDRVEQFAVLQTRYQTLSARYGERLPTAELMHAAIRAMADSVDDAHTRWVSAEEYAEQRRWERGEVSYGGIGARMRGPRATVAEVFPSSPAERVGLQVGDTLVTVDGRDVRDLRVDEVVRQVRGAENTTVTLGVERAGSGRVEQIPVVRARVSAPFVTARKLPGNLGYVQLRGFPEPSIVTQVEQAIRQHQQDGVRGIVFDLRGNGGGRLDVGTRLLSRFVPNGPIYQRVDRDGRRETYQVRDARPLLTVPLAVLIDEGTASMGEVFAAAVSEHRVGRVFGATTAGAVAASRFLPLSDGSALQLSLEQVYTGAGALLDRVGVRPDEAVELDLDQLRQGRDTQLERVASYLQATPAAAR